KITQKQQIKKVKLKCSNDFAAVGGKLMNVSDCVYIYYNREKVVYALRYTYSMEDNVGNVKLESRYNYFEQMKGLTYGQYLDSPIGVRNRLQFVDSLPQLQAFITLKFFDKENDSLISNKEEGQNDFQKYIPIKKKDDSYPD